MKSNFKASLLSVTILSLAIVFIACGEVQSKDDNTKTTAANPVLENMAQRKSVRKYTDQKVSRDTIDILLRAAMAAPSGRDLRPWHFIVLDDRTALDNLAANSAATKILKSVPQALLICADTTLSAWWSMDCALAGQNFILAAQSMGLSTVWTGAYPNMKRAETIRKAMNMPENIVPITVIPFGYGNGTEKPRDKYETSKIHYNKW